MVVELIEVDFGKKHVEDAVFAESRRLLGSAAGSPHALGRFDEVVLLPLAEGNATVVPGFGALPGRSTVGAS